jgi:hypothetical protein
MEDKFKLNLLRGISCLQIVSPPLALALKLLWTVSDTYQVVHNLQKPQNMSSSEVISLLRNFTTIVSMRFSLGYIPAFINIVHTWKKVNHSKSQGQLTTLQKSWTLVASTYKRVMSFVWPAPVMEAICLQDIKRKP